MLAQLSFLALFFISNSLAVIVGDLSCSAQGKYTYSATACSNKQLDEICEALYPEVTPGSGHPQTGNSAPRPLRCYNAPDIWSPDAQAFKSSAIENCAKTCGFCCLTPAFNCENSLFPRLPCAALEQPQCQSPVWRSIIEQDCPNVCGFCLTAPTTKIPILIGDPIGDCTKPDTTAACATWAANGFCESELYTYAQKKQYCSTTCKTC